MKVSKDTIARTVFLAVSLLNAVLTMFGKNELPITQDTIYTIVTVCMLVISTIVAWWKNNSFSTAAIKADEYLKEIKGNDEK